MVTPSPAVAHLSKGDSMPDSRYTSERYRATARRILTALVTNLSGVLACDSPTIELAVMTVAAGGHLLLEDVPGIGKTTLARALAASVQGTVNRVQFTSDMLPSDLTGVTVFDQNTRDFTFFRGPVFTQILLADEINRANPKAQAALLEAMEERRVTVDGTSYDLPRPFTVIATQNPVEMEGTYPLPEAQLDRFMTRMSLGYPSAEAEARMLVVPSGHDPLAGLQPVCTTSDLLAVIQTAAHIHVSDAVARYAVAILTATRTNPRVRLGASPRAGLALLALSRVRALMCGHEAVFPGDVRAAVAPVLTHRLLFDESTGVLSAQDRAELLDAMVKTVPAPRGA